MGINRICRAKEEDCNFGPMLANHVLDGYLNHVAEEECPCCATHSCDSFRRWVAALIDDIREMTNTPKR